MREQAARRAAGEGRPLRRQAQRRRHDGRRVRGAVPGAGAQRRAPASCSTTRATSRCCSAPQDCRPAADRRRHARGRRLPRAAPRAAPRAPGRAADAGRRPRRWPRSATPCWRCGARCSVEHAGSRAPGRALAAAAGAGRAWRPGWVDPLRARLATGAGRRANPGARSPPPWCTTARCTWRANLAGALLVGALGVVARVPAAHRAGLAGRLAADAARPAAAAGPGALRRPVGRAARRRGGRGAVAARARTAGAGALIGARDARRAGRSRCSAKRPGARRCSIARRLGHRRRAVRPRQRRALPALLCALAVAC